MLGIAAVSLPARAQPANDNCANATALQVGSSVNGSNVGATQDGSSTCGFNTSRDVWHSLVVPCDGNLTVYTCPASFDTVISLHDGCPGTTLNELACNDDSAYCGTAYPTASAFTVHVGRGVYLVRVSGYNGSSGTYTLNAVLDGERPFNDDCSSPWELYDGFSTSDTTSCATPDGSSSCGNSAGPDVWYRYVAQCSGTLHVYTCPASFDSVISVHSGCPGTIANEIACNDDSGYCGTTYPRASHVAIPVVATTTYMIRVAGYNGASGPFTLHTDLDHNAPPANDSCPGAITLGNGSTPFSTCSATTDSIGEPSPCSLYEFCDVWYRYTATSSGSTGVSLCDSNFDTQIAIYGATCPTATGQTIACNDHACGLGSYVVFPSTAGQSYLIRVGSGALYGVQGQGTMTISPCYANCDASTAPPILNVNDFVCFLNSFAAGNGYANCDNSNNYPVLNVNDFICFLNQFAAGCS
jgi:hypothetical protein